VHPDARRGLDSILVIGKGAFEAFQAKLTAFKIINQISENLEKSFAPYCEAVLPIMLENFAFKFSEALRKQALKTCVNILHAVSEPINVNVFQVALYPALIT
jgi:hypothetical protein